MEAIEQVLPQPSDELLDALHKASEQLYSGNAVDVEVARDVSRVMSGMTRKEAISQLGTWYLNRKAKLDAKEAELKPLIDHMQSEIKFHRQQVEFVKWVITCILPPKPDAEFVDEYCSLFYSESKQTIVNNPDAVPIEYCKIETIPQLTAIGDAISGGIEVPGCEVKTNYNLQVKLGGERAIANAKARAKRRQLKVEGGDND